LPMSGEPLKKSPLAKS